MIVNGFAAPPRYDEFLISDPIFVSDINGLKLNIACRGLQITLHGSQADLSNIVMAIDRAQNLYSAQHPISFKERNESAEDDEDDEDEVFDAEDVDPGFDLAQNGQACEKKGDINGAIRYYEAAVTLQCTSLLPNERLSILYRKQKRLDDEIRVCDAGIAVLGCQTYCGVAKKVEWLRNRKRVAIGLQSPSVRVSQVPVPVATPTQPLTKRGQAKQLIAENKAAGVACCPKCGSTSISANKKGFGFGKAAAGAFVAGPVGLVGGTLGANKMIITCLNCGHKYKPGGK